MLNDALIAKYKKDGKRFEIFVDKDKAYLYHIGECTRIDDVLVVEEVYKDAKKGNKWDDKTLVDAFGTADAHNIADYILKHGEVPLTTDQRRKKIQDKQKQIIELIRQETIDPRTDAPHTLIRIQNAVEQAKIQIDAFKPAEQQVEQVMKAIRLIIPLKVERVTIAVKVPAAYAARAYGVIKEYNPTKHEWTAQGALIALVELPAGMQEQFYSKINAVAHGNIETKIISKK